jgi:1,4-alpha-glucan branching enzyme
MKTAAVAKAIDSSLQAIIDSNHADPFSYLGPHRLDGSEDIVVRAFLPQATKAEVIPNFGKGAPVPMEKVHPDGFYIANLGKVSAPFKYKLRLHNGPNSWDIEDPYRFGSGLGEVDLHLLAEGTHYRTYDKLGAHIVEHDGIKGVRFTVWAPNARRVSVVGDFNDWDGRRHPMRVHYGCGIWEIFLPEVGEGAHYKFEIRGQGGNLLPLKADPYAFFSQQSPGTASIVYDGSRYQWADQQWMAKRGDAAKREAPISIYEVHLGSWKRKIDEGFRPYSYLELADQLIPYVKEMGFTHIELLPVSEYPFDGSWGYQPIGLFSPTSRFGKPDDFRHFVDKCHQAGLGVILDWVVGHFPKDEHGLGLFDGTHLYEHADPRLGQHMDWGTLIYNFSRAEVANYLLANALYWLDHFHIDGLRVDAVASMLYLDYSRKPGEWVPNEFGGNENLSAIAFLKRMNQLVYGTFPGTFTVAEESTSYPMVSKPTDMGGLGFGYKWNMGWMNDTLEYISKEPVHRKFHHNNLTFSMLYAFSENFVLPLSHDEVVHGKRSLLGRMPGDRWQQFANLRLYLAYMYGHPGKKLLFMGSELAQGNEWNANDSLQWHLLDYPEHAGIRQLVTDLNRLYRDIPALHRLDCEGHGFQWIECNDRDQGVVSFIRRAEDPNDHVVVICNFTPVVRHDYRIGVPRAGKYREILNSDSTFYGGSDVGNATEIEAYVSPAHGQACSLTVSVPPLATLMLRPKDRVVG